jgi:acetate---CoA ligase (ADP-forming)
VTTPGTGTESVRAMLEARSVALVGASPRPGSFGSRMLAEVAKSAARPRAFLVNPRYREIDGAPCFGSVADLPEVPDLALLAVPDAALEQQLGLAATVGCRAAVIFGNANEAATGGDEAAGGAPAGRRTLRVRLAAIARDGGMALCGAGCMGFANVSYGLRALGYTEPDPIAPGPVALVTHSGSVFSALLRARRGFGFTLAVSSGQELVTAAPGYLDYALDLPDTRLLALVLEAIRDGDGLRRVLGRAAERDVPVVLLAVGGSAGGRAMVAAHSGALAGSDGSWEALARAYGVHRVSDLAELADTVELFAAGRRARVPAAGDRRAGIATVHDSGLERAHVVDVAESLRVPFAQIGRETTARLADLLDAGLVPANPLDVWGTGAGTRELFGGALQALAADPAVAAVALAVDLVPELDGDESYPLAMLDTAECTGKPLAVLSNLGSTLDAEWAARLRASGIPVLEGTRSGLVALRHLIDHPRARAAAAAAAKAAAGAPRVDAGRLARATELLAGGEPDAAALLDLLACYGITVARTVPAASLDAALGAAAEIGYPVVLKTGEPALAHKSDVRGVLTGVADAGQLGAGYADLAVRLGPRVLVCQHVPAGVELALGVVTDRELGPLIVVGAGGVLVELLDDRVVALPPVCDDAAGELLDALRVRALLDGARGAPQADFQAIRRAICALSDLAWEIGDRLAALDINPLICGPVGAVAVDALAVPTRSGSCA